MSGLILQFQQKMIIENNTFWPQNGSKCNNFFLIFFELLLWGQLLTPGADFRRMSQAKSLFWIKRIWNFQPKLAPKKAPKRYQKGKRKLNDFQVAFWFDFLAIGGSEGVLDPGERLPPSPEPPSPEGSRTLTDRETSFAGALSVTWLASWGDGKRVIGTF